MWMQQERNGEGEKLSIKLLLLNLIFHSLQTLLDASNCKISSSQRARISTFHNLSTHFLIILQKYSRTL